VIHDVDGLAQIRPQHPRPRIAGQDDLGMCHRDRIYVHVHHAGIGRRLLGNLVYVSQRGNA